MMQPKRCKHCDEQQARGHNFCRVCGFHVRKGYVRHAKMALAYYTHEKFCGYCGQPRHSGSCNT
ncbi:hypothetical protein MASR1M49_15050 [Pararhodobacter aggregans]